MTPERVDDPLLEVLRHLFPALSCSASGGRPAGARRGSANCGRDGHCRWPCAGQAWPAPGRGPANASAIWSAASPSVSPGRASPPARRSWRRAMMLLRQAARLFLIRQEHERLARQFDVLRSTARSSGVRAQAAGGDHRRKHRPAAGWPRRARSCCTTSATSASTLRRLAPWATDSGAVVFYATEGIIGKVAATLQGVRVADTARSFDFKPASRRTPASRPSSVDAVRAAGGTWPFGLTLIGVINASRRLFPDRPSKEGFSEGDLSLFGKVRRAGHGGDPAFPRVRGPAGAPCSSRSSTRSAPSWAARWNGGQLLQRALTCWRPSACPTPSCSWSAGRAEVQRQHPAEPGFHSARPWRDCCGGGRGTPAPGSSSGSRAPSTCSRQNPRSMTYLYAESGDALLFEDEHNRRVMETVSTSSPSPWRTTICSLDVSESNRRWPELDRRRTS